MVMIFEYNITCCKDCINKGSNSQGLVVLIFLDLENLFPCPRSEGSFLRSDLTAVGKTKI